MATRISPAPDQTLSARVERESGQSLIYTEHAVLVAGPSQHKVRVILRNDSYREQCYGRLDRWDGERWHEVVSMPGPALKMDTGLAYREQENGLRASDFRADRDALVARAKEIL